MSANVVPEQIFGVVIVAMLTVLGILLSWLIIRGVTYLKVRITLVEDAKTKSLLDNLVTLAGQKVLMVQQTVISDMKRAVVEGSVKKEDLPKLLATAKSSAIEAIKRDAQALGVWGSAVDKMGDANALLNWLSDVVESQVAQLPPSGLRQPPKSDA